MGNLANFPYQEIIAKLLGSTMSAQAILISAYRNGKPTSACHGDINKEFSWLARKYKKGGVNRHFFDEPDTSIKTLRATGGVGTDSTRISRLIVVAFDDDIKTQSRYSKSGGSLSIRSPLAIIYDFLTIPSNLGSRAYALLALRNYLFGELMIVPETVGVENGLAANVIDRELSTIWTSLRERYFSKGADKLPVGSTKNPATAVVRHFLAMRGILRFYFPSISQCQAYFESHRLTRQGDKIDPYHFEFEKSPRLEKLPEAGEIVNELCGLPLPIRGADTIFRGGLKFSGNGGLVMAIHGGPGCGKTSLALSFGAYLAPFGIETLFFSGEEAPRDLSARLPSLVPEGIRRLTFFEKSISNAFTFARFDRHADSSSHLGQVKDVLGKLGEILATELSPANEFQIPKPCRSMIVLDGLHDLVADKVKPAKTSGDDRNKVEELYELIEAAKRSGALVVLTTGENWSGHTMLDYLVDVAIHLSHESMAQYGAKPDRRLRLLKARHQLCAVGTHGFQIAGTKGVRFSPQINYQIDRRSIWKVGIPDHGIFKDVLQKVRRNVGGRGTAVFDTSANAPRIFSGSHVFINGEGSGGKASLALKVAMAPSFDGPDHRINKNEKILVVSFLYPKEYYENVRRDLSKILAKEYRLNDGERWNSRMEVIRLYAGHLKPNDLYNRIEWELEAAELYGDPYTCVVIDGIHNVFLQFPEIEGYTLFWPQIYNSLRSRSIMTITTHTTLSVRSAIEGEATSIQPIDNNRSEPLRHALVQKTDFQFEVDPLPLDKYPGNTYSPTLFGIRTMSAIGQPIPKGYVLWDRESKTLMDADARGDARDVPTK